MHPILGRGVSQGEMRRGKCREKNSQNRCGGMVDRRSLRSDKAFFDEGATNDRDVMALAGASYHPAPAFDYQHGFC